jgi:hypothetical protein
MAHISVDIATVISTPCVLRHSLVRRRATDSSSSARPAVPDNYQNKDLLPPPNALEANSKTVSEPPLPSAVLDVSATSEEEGLGSFDDHDEPENQDNDDETENQNNNDETDKLAKVEENVSVPIAVDNNTKDEDIWGLPRT